MGAVRGVLAGTLALTALQTVVGTDRAAGRVTGLLADLNRLLNSALSPDVPAIPDLRGRRTSSSTPLPVAAGSWGDSGGPAPGRYGDDNRQPTSGGLLQPQFAAKLNALVAASGGRVKVGSGWRSYTEQAALYDRWVRRVPGQAPAAKPGTSKHETGEAADLVYTGDGRAWAHDNAARFGLRFPLGYEPWHIESR
jgi:hypothetical protein